MKTSNGVNVPEHTYIGSVWSYSLGFIGSLALTLIAYALVAYHLAAPMTALAAVVGLALLQLILQVTLFLHVGRHSRAVNVVALGFTLVIVTIIVAGSLWVMGNLNARMMPSAAQMNTYMQSQGGSF